MKRLLILAIATVAVNAQDIYTTFTVKAKQEATLAFNATGVINKFSVDIGSLVKKGDLLGALKSDDIRANLDLAKVSLKFTKSNLDRMRRVKSVIDRAKFDKFEFDYNSAKAKLLYTKALYNKTLLKAPFSGVITAKYLEVGDAVSGMTLKPVLKLESRSDRKLILEIDQKYYSSVKAGDTFKYSFDGQSKKYEVKIAKVYPAIDARSRKIKAEAYIKDVPSGLFGTGTIVTKD